jgi:hypothetical protein
MGESGTISPKFVETLANWSGLPLDARRRRELATVLPSFRERVARLDQADAEAFEYDFLQPKEPGS